MSSNLNAGLAAKPSPNGAARAGASGIVLAGGRSRRMGSPKSELLLDGRTLLDRTMTTLSSVVDEVFVVGSGGMPTGVTAVPDRFPDAGPLGGLATGLRAAQRPYAVVVACDLPFLQADLLRILLDLAPGYEAVVPRVDGRVQPLHAVFASRVWRAAAAEVQAEHLRMEDFVESLRVRWVEEHEIEPLDPLHRSFINVNTPGDWARARAQARVVL